MLAVNHQYFSHDLQMPQHGASSEFQSALQSVYTYVLYLYFIPCLCHTLTITFIHTNDCDEMSSDLP